MNIKEMKEHTKDLYDSVLNIFKDEQTIDLAIYENIFEDNYIKTFVLLLSYFKLANVPNKVLEICIDCKNIPKDTYEVFYEYCQNKWLGNAYKEINHTIAEIEKDNS